jgi:hypothetical protein
MDGGSSVTREEPSRTAPKAAVGADLTEVKVVSKMGAPSLPPLLIACQPINVRMSGQPSAQIF